MSGDNATEDEAKPPSEESGDGGVIPVEVEPPVEVAPTDPVADLEHKLAAAEKEKKENWDRYLRAAADLENMRKRVKRELEDAKFDTKNKILKEMLPVVDNLERAIEHASGAAPSGGPEGSMTRGGSGEKNPIVEGVQLVLRQFSTAFERLEVTPVEAMGQPFDPNL